MIKKKILIHSIVFSPDGVSTAYLYNDIVLGFKDAGYEVVVLTTTPHYNLIETALQKQPLNRKLFGLFYESDFDGIPVILSLIHI
jgi:colanic acid biosynthesis glycosyl transferase WcaI